MKWDFEKLNEAVDLQHKTVNEKWSEDKLKKAKAKLHSEWYENYNKEYQDGFEALLSEAGWTRFEYCDEYDLRIGYDCTAGHPAYFTKPFGRFIHGLKMIQAYERDCQVSVDEKNNFVVRPPSYYPAHCLLDRVCPTDMVDLQRYGFKWDIESMGFVFWLGPKNA